MPNGWLKRLRESLRLGVDRGSPPGARGVVLWSVSWLFWACRMLQLSHGKKPEAIGEEGAIVTDAKQGGERVRRLRYHSQAGPHSLAQQVFNAGVEGT